MYLDSWPPITIAMPTWRRAKYFETTMRSILKQNYPGGIEIVVVNSGPDSEMEMACAAHNAKYIVAPRDDYPEFQNIAELWNMCFAAASNEIVIMQCAEISYWGDESIHALVDRVMRGNKILATSLVRDLNEQNVMTNWQNHPREGSRPGWISGSGPHAFRKSEMMEHGGYDTRFYGYGHEDDFFFYTLRKNGWDIVYVEEAICDHQAHPRVPYEQVTGYANRALIRILYTDVEFLNRAPLPNRAPILIETDVDEDLVTASAVMINHHYKTSQTYKDWLQRWLDGDHRPDETFVAQRTMSNEGDELGEMITEAAWAVIRAKEAHEESDRTAQLHPSWSNRCANCGDIQLTWAARALHRAVTLMTEDRKK